jgi:GxxExxY protein
MNHQDTKSPRRPGPVETDRVARQVVDAAFRLHSGLGPGLLESVYQICLAHELRSSGHKVDEQLILPIVYRDLQLDAGLRLAMLVDGCVVVELKAVENVLPVHKAQLLTYLKLSSHRLGLLINLNVLLIKDTPTAHSPLLD